MKKIYQKLIRDRIPGVIADAGKSFATRKASEAELLDYGSDCRRRQVLRHT